jgi:hypothetical protein
MSYIGATGLTDDGERFDELQENIDANASYINNLVGIPDPLHTAVFGINVLNPGLFGLVERAEVKIKLLETAEEGLGTDLTGLTTQVEGIQTEVTGIQTEILGIQGEITGIDSSISAIQFVQIPALGVLIGTADGIAVDARNKANRALDIWDYSGDNVYHKKAGNVGIGNTFGSTLTNKLEVQGNINIPTGSTFRIGDEPFNYSHLAGTQPVSSKWTNATDVNTNIYYNSGNVGIGVTTAINNKMEVAGNLNISAGSKYKINNVDLAFSDLGGTLSYNSLTNQLSGGTNIQILNGVINNTYELPKATTNAIGGVRPDGTTITINTSTGVISSAAATPQVNSDWTQTNTSLKSFIQNKPTAGTNISLANNTITNIITGSPTQNIITLNDNYLIVKDKPDSQKITEVDVPLTSGNEPVSTPSVVPTTEGNPLTHKTLNFAYVPPPLIYNFTNDNTSASWLAKAATIPTFTYSLDYILNAFDPDAVFTAGSVIGWVQMTLPSTHNFFTITYGLGTQAGSGEVRLLINGVVKSTYSINNSVTTYSQAYNVGDVVRIEETLSTMSANFIFQFTNTNYITNTYTLSVQSGTSIQVNNGTAQYLSGNYTISVGATQSSVLISGFSPANQTDPYPLQNGSTIAIRYSMLQRITSLVNYKKDGLIKYVPASGTNPSTGSWNIIDLDTQPLTQFAGNLPANRLDNIDMSKVATGNLDWSRIASQPALSSLSGNLPLNRTDGNLPANRLDNIDMGKVATGNLHHSRVQDLYLGINNRFWRIEYAYENVITFGGIYINKFRINTNLHLNSYNEVYNYFQYFLSMSPNNLADRHMYWFGVVKMSNKIGSDSSPLTRSTSILSSDSSLWEIKETNSTSGVWWLNVWVYTTTFCESIICILH